MPAAAAARSISNGSPATAPPPSSARSPSSSASSSPRSAASTARGTPSSTEPGSTRSRMVRPPTRESCSRKNGLPPPATTTRSRRAGGTVAGDQLARLLAGERLQLQQVAELLALGADQGARQRAAEPAGPVGHRHEHGSGRRAAQQMADQLDALGVRPVQVVHQQHQRLPAGQAREQLAQGPVGAVALGLEAGGDRGGPAELAEHGRELAGDAVAQPRELALADTHEVVAERVHQHAVGAARLELDPAAGEHERAVALGAQAQLREQPALAQPQRARDRQEARPAVPSRARQHRLDRGQLLLPPHERERRARRRLRLHISPGRPQLG